MIVVYLTHGLFLTCIQKITCIYKSCIAIYIQMYNNPLEKITPCANKITQLYLLWEPASLLVVTNSHPPLSLVCQQLSHPLAFNPLTLSHPTVHITLFTWTTSTISVIFVQDTYHLLKLFQEKFTMHSQKHSSLKNTTYMITFNSAR
jgi:hypothetical protein